MKQKNIFLPSFQKLPLSFAIRKTVSCKQKPINDVISSMNDQKFAMDLPVLNYNCQRPMGNKKLLW